MNFKMWLKPCGPSPPGKRRFACPPLKPRLNWSQPSRLNAAALSKTWPDRPRQLLRPQCVRPVVDQGFAGPPGCLEQTFLRWYEAREQMVEYQEPEEVRTMKAIHAYNQRLYVQYRDWPLDDVLRFFHQSYNQIFAVVKQIPEEDLFTPHRFPWTGRWTLAAFVIANTSNHYLWAKNRIIRWKKQVTS